MLKYLVFLFVIPALVYGQATNVRTCSGFRPFPYEVRVVGCETMPCIVRRGTDALMSLDFSPHVRAEGLRPVVFASVLGATINYPLPEDLQDACRHIGPNLCPLEAGTQTTYNFVFAVNPSYPPITVGVEVNLLNHEDVPVSCFVVDIAVRF